MSILRVENLTKNFGGVLALSDLSFEVEFGKVFGIIGPNGSGKTTFFNLTTGFLRPERGHILFQGKDMTSLPSHCIASSGIVRTYQSTALFDSLSVAENVRIGTHTRTRSGVLDAIFSRRKTRQDRKYSRKRVEELLAFSGLAHVAGERADSLSYGDQRRLEIAIALAAEPEVLLLDEPAAGMNQAESERLADLVRALCSKDITVLIVEHNMKLMMTLCDRILVLDHGVKLVEDLPENIIKNPEVIKVYFGEEMEFA